MKKLIQQAMLLLTLPLSATAVSTQLPVDEIIHKANLASYYAGDDGSAEARMMIVDKNGSKQIRQFNILRKDIEDEGRQNMLVIFSRPTDVKGTVFRVEKQVAVDDNRWLYLPALDLVKRISAGDKRTSFVGSHFYYEDVSGRNPQEDSFELLDTTAEHFIVKGTPKKPETVEFAYYQAKISTTSFLPLEVVYYNAKGKPMRQMTVKKTANIQGIPTVVHSRIDQLSDGSYTEMMFRKVKYDLGLPQGIFSERSQRKPPQKWLK
ncbi:outer membrane lipoprotein-sorting protein [Thalassomonas viridans]|uniref:Outer membrane lipoprotein-sorting protein n=1 Tax=Thalassomonas viridans TaxID=137584 RepID=A0AAE9Z8I5_9GAMM|nr:outer membrane lipoprotein-sorting protein [Thalassomonas viridans]WDE08478.1 outer membrane lipoprotein-sorting protein [Thalassomonas viridans]